jgi:HSP20 family protein
MRRDDRDDPFDDIFREIERMMDEMMDGDAGVRMGPGPDESGFGTDTHVDVHDRDEELRVIADLPGVEKEAIDLKCDGETLTISAKSDRREYDERVELPTRVDEHSAGATYNHRVLEVVLQKREGDDSADIDVN